MEGEYRAPFFGIQKLLKVLSSPSRNFVRSIGNIKRRGRGKKKHSLNDAKKKFSPRLLHENVTAAMENKKKKKKTLLLAH